MKSQHHKKDHHKKATITTGPIYVPPFNIIFPNDKLIVTLKNPTHKKLKAQVMLGLCPSPNAGGWGTYVPGNGTNNVQKFEVNETEFSLGWVEVDPMSCLRLEKEFGYDLLDSVIRLTATGDFEICKDSCTPICGKLEISSVVGFSGSPIGPNAPALPADIAPLAAYYYVPSGVLGTDPQTHVPYADWVVCEDKCDCGCKSHSDSDSHSDSSSSSSSDGHY